jgi:hypothetical protein
MRMLSARLLLSRNLAQGLGLGLLFVAAHQLSLRTAAANNLPGHRWWPAQEAPKAIVRTDLALMQQVADPGGQRASTWLGPEHMMVESVAGLAAQAVNEGRGDELVWIDMASESYAQWYQGMTNRLRLVDRGVFKPWALVERFTRKGIVKGYILYSYDYSTGGATKLRPDSDESVNVATSLAGLLQGVLVSVGQEKQAKRLGLKLLFDARGKTEAWCFANYRDQLNRTCALVQDPQMPQCRDLAIAHRMMAIYGYDAPTPDVYAWLRPLSSVIGWNGGEEAKSVAPISRAGHTLLPCNWSMNLCALSAGSENCDASAKPATAAVRPPQLDESGHSVSFIMSDGDNVQWLMGAFCTDERYWASPDRGKFPMGWGAPLACLDQACPEVLKYLKQTQPANSTLSLHGGGYFYPDLLGLDRGPAERKTILVEHARRMGYYMNRSGCSTLMLLTMDLDNPAAHEAYEIFAREIPGLLGMFVMQYYPYEAGDGKVFWVRARNADEVPVVTCKYRLWVNTPGNKPRAGTPAKVAHAINESVRQSEAAGQRLNAWAITHVWSGFKQITGGDESAENAAGEPGAKYALTPTGWCVQRLDPKVKVVSPEELLWRIRMEHAPEQTKRLWGN